MLLLVSILIRIPSKHLQVDELLSETGLVSKSYRVIGGKKINRVTRTSMPPDLVSSGEQGLGWKEISKALCGVNKSNKMKHASPPVFSFLAHSSPCRALK